MATGLERPTAQPMKPSKSGADVAGELGLWLWVIVAFAGYGYQFIDLIPDILRVLGLDI
jgi:hypothetical protein